LVARLLAQRGFTDVERARAFLCPQHYRPASPYHLADMPQAVALLHETIAGAAHIRIWGDFDTDGQTSSAVLFEALQALGARVDYRLPLRHQGHGFSLQVVQAALQDGVELLLTCDTGIGDIETVAAARQAGIAVIITDHHDLGTALPEANAIINPKRLPPGHPLRELSGVGVAYLLAHALLQESPSELRLPELLDLVALGLIGDIATQVDEVRYLCQIGLEALRRTARPGLRALMALANIDAAHADEQDVGYQLAPRLNAAGRLADAASVVELLTTRDAGAAESLARQLEALNLERRAHTETATQQAERLLQAQPDLLRQPALILESESWEPGVVGLVAGDLARRYQRPAILIAHRPGGPSVGSARSVEGIDIHRAIAAQAELLLREGGHPMAAGFAIAPENLPAFRDGLLTDLRSAGAETRPEPVLQIDACVPARELTLDLARAMAQLAPHGPGNPRPVLLLADASLLRAEDVSRNQETAHRHLHLRTTAEEPLRVTWFNAGELPMADEPIEVALQIGLNYWRERESLQLTLVDWRPALATPADTRPSLVTGREVVDWRTRSDREALYIHLKATYGDRIVWWGEGADDLPDEAASRADLPDGPRLALAILTAPAGPEVLQCLLKHARPQVLYVLPLYRISNKGADMLLKQVGGLLQASVQRHEGWLDIPRMAARIAAREDAVRAALLGLAARGRIALWESEGRWRVASATEALPAPARLIQPPSVAQARESLVYVLRETAAYRRAFESDPLDGLLGV
jgi:single-stranded-DNA-specific exonuclease